MPISPANKERQAVETRADTGRERNAHAGFTLIEVVLALAVLGLLAALGLPFVRQNSSSAALRARTFEITSLLRAERNLALRSGTATTVLVDAERSTITSDTSRARIVLPSSTAIRLSSDGLSGFHFFPDGRASGGRLSITSGRQSYVVDVNNVTSAISIAGGRP